MKVSGKSILKSLIHAFLYYIIGISTICVGMNGITQFSLPKGKDGKAKPFGWFGLFSESDDKSECKGKGDCDAYEKGKEYCKKPKTSDTQEQHYAAVGGNKNNMRGGDVISSKESKKLGETETDKKGGHLAKRKDTGSLILREIAQSKEEDILAFQDIGKYRYFNTNNIWIRLDALKELETKFPGLTLVSSEKYEKIPLKSITTYTQKDNLLFGGFLDLVYEHDDGFLIIDWKTDWQTNSVH